jgi:sterol desaturase/sphingolipid hydroxylase (fatty acid hydroxylase superfamily)
MRAAAIGKRYNVCVLNYIALAVPFFFLFIGLEIWAARRSQRDVYRAGDAVSSISAGIFQQVALIFGKLAILGAYALVYSKLHVLPLSEKAPWVWVLAFVLVDFAYYWWHRLSHEVSLLWAAHVVHHSSEDYNLSTALRQGILTPFTILPFHLPLAILGVPPLVLAACESFNTLYQFWIHTQLIGKLGPAEKWINTPSLHRVHHAINPRYLDKNYGGTSVIWDRLFGTWEPETEAPVYGLVKPLHSYNALRAQFHYWGELRKRAQTPLLIDKARAFFKGPEWSPPGVRVAAPQEVSPETFVKYDPPLSPGLRRYVLVQLALGIAFATALMLLENSLPLSRLLFGAGLIYASLVAWSGLIEGRRWGWAAELVRLSLVVVAALSFASGGPRLLPAAVASLAFAVVMAAWLLRQRAAPAVLSAP